MFGQNFDPFNQKPNRPQPPIAGSKIPQTPQDKKMQRKQVMRFLFNPELGSSFEGMAQTHSMFLRLMANIFLQTGLIDASFRGFTDPTAMGLASLMREAYKNLEFTKEGLPKVLLFGAFVGSLAAVVLSAILFALALAGHPKHAQPITHLRQSDSSALPQNLAAPAKSR